MNIFSIIILATLAVDFILNLVADLKNMQALDPELPAASTG